MLPGQRWGVSPPPGCSALEDCIRRGVVVKAGWREGRVPGEASRCAWDAYSGLCYDEEVMWGGPTETLTGAATVLVLQKLRPQAAPRRAAVSPHQGADSMASCVLEGLIILRPPNCSNLPVDWWLGP